MTQASNLSLSLSLSQDFITNHEGRGLLIFLKQDFIANHKGRGQNASKNGATISQANDKARIQVYHKS